MKDLALDLSMSTITGLGDLAEDEVISIPLPMEVLLKNVKIHLTEDRPPVNITSPGPVPINVQIGKMRICRDNNGIFQIQPLDDENPTEAKAGLETRADPCERRKERDREMLSLQLVLQQLKIDNDSLKRQLSSSEKSYEINK